VTVGNLSSFSSLCVTARILLSLRQRCRRARHAVQCELICPVPRHLPASISQPLPRRHRGHFAPHPRSSPSATKQRRRARDCLVDVAFQNGIPGSYLAHIIHHNNELTLLPYDIFLRRLRNEHSNTVRFVHSQTFTTHHNYKCVVCRAFT
jgi:hypothetical protein